MFVNNISSQGKRKYTYQNNACDSEPHQQRKTGYRHFHGLHIKIVNLQASALLRYSGWLLKFYITSFPRNRSWKFRSTARNCLETERPLN